MYFIFLANVSIRRTAYNHCGRMERVRGTEEFLQSTRVDLMDVAMIGDKKARRFAEGLSHCFTYKVVGVLRGIVGAAHHNQSWERRL